MRSRFDQNAVTNDEFVQPFDASGSLPYELRSPMVPSFLWMRCSTLSRIAVLRPAACASALVSYFLPARVEPAR